ncbi:MAG TPA: hypothetical protein G4O02_09685 [Caldilineae bacterium]|nr:hypothetical protein [Caldilineae bacterium]
MRRHRFLLTFSFTILIAVLGLATLPLTDEVSADAADYTRGDLILLTDDGGFPDWSPDGSKIYFSRVMEDGYYDVWRMNPDGTGQECLTCGHPRLPNKHQGNPRVHPSGRYVVFQVEKAQHQFVIGKTLTSPGIGRYNDLWALDLETGEVYQLTDVSPEGVSGSIIGDFNRAGTKLLWTHIEGRTDEFDDMALAVADFVTTPVPHLENITYYNPGPDPGWMEAHGWGPDDTWIYFSCTPFAGMTDMSMDICRMDFRNPTEVTRLTFTSGLKKKKEEAAWDEHANLSPLNDAFVWMSSQPYGIPSSTSKIVNELKADLWIMDVNGGNPRRLTFFNDPGSPDYTGERAIVSENAWSPDGTQVVMRVQFRDSTKPNRIYLLRLNREVATPSPTPEPSTETMHIGDLDGTSYNWRNKWYAKVTITVHDGQEWPVTGATVSGTWGDGASGTASCTTDQQGRCSVTSAAIRKKSGSVIFRVERVEHATLGYVPDMNHDPDGDSDGTEIIVEKP